MPSLASAHRGEARHVSWLTRSKGFFPMEYSNLGLEYFSPDYIDFFYQLPQWKKDELLRQQDLLYKGISALCCALPRADYGNSFPLEPVLFLH